MSEERAEESGLGACLNALDWPELLEQLAAQAHSARGAAACRALELASDAAEAQARMALVAEGAAVLRAGRVLPRLDFPEVEDTLAAAQRGEILGVDELRAVAVLGETIAAARHFFLARPGDVDTRAVAGPGLQAMAQALDAQQGLTAAIRETFDAAGQIRDAVSPELARLRRERDATSARVREQIESLLASDEYAPHLQDRFVTLRADRFVLPLRASSKSMGLGIVHDTSRTGETVFVEPTAMVGLNNRLKVAEIAIERECRRILDELARQVAGAAPALREAMDGLAHLDVLGAQARLAAGYQGELVEIVDDPVVHLSAARHPLLALAAATSGTEVVANDIWLGGAGVDEGAAGRVLVLSGPNAGGKTVVLKTVGLAALLARAGMPLPVERGSRIGFFDPVLADVGDRQSVLGGLSTFSAHLANLGMILREGRRPGARPLVLLDELMAGTNPEQGAALARAVLEAVVELPGLGVVTTHYDALKALAEKDHRFRNAGMEYDLERLAPTFRLRDGVPGRSYAFDIAERLGLPEGLLARARALAGGGTAGLEDVVATLEAREAALEREREALARARAELEGMAGAERAAVEALERRERELARHSRQAIDEAVREAREAIRAIVREAQRAGSQRAAEAARAAVAETAQRAVARLPAPEPPVRPEPPAVAPGTRVAVASLGREAVVVQPPDARGRAKVSFGKHTLDVDASELRVVGQAPPPARSGKNVPGAGKPKARRREEVAAPDEKPLEWAVPTAASTLDLRGLRADEALAAVETFLDRAALDGTSPVFIVHGHGTGALRKAVRQLLARSPYVRHWQPGGEGQGGDGVSVVEL